MCFSFSFKIFSHSTDQPTTYTLWSKEKTAEPRGTIEADGIKTSRKPLKYSANDRSIAISFSMCYFTTRVLRPIQYISTETRKTEHKAVHRCFTSHWRKQFSRRPPSQFMPHIPVIYHLIIVNQQFSVFEAQQVASSSDSLGVEIFVLFERL